MRTDVHSPANLVTEDYEYSHAIDSQLPNEHARLILDRLIEDGWTFASIHPSGQCDHCGALIRYRARMLHRPSRTIIEIGETCLDNRFERSTADFQRLRKQAELDRQEQRLLQAERQWVRLHLDMAWLMDLRDDDHYILKDMRRKLRQYGSLSERQIAFAKRLLVERLDREEEAKRNPAPAKITIPDSYIGRVTFTATILGTKWVDSDYGDQFKALVQVTTDTGTFTLWGTVPRAQMTTEKGETVKWTATVQRSRNDDTHGFFSRPRVAN